MRPQSSLHDGATRVHSLQPAECCPAIAPSVISCCQKNTAHMNTACRIHTLVTCCRSAKWHAASSAAVVPFHRVGGQDGGHHREACVHQQMRMHQLPTVPGVHFHDTYHCCAHGPCAYAVGLQTPVCAQELQARAPHFNVNHLMMHAPPAPPPQACACWRPAWTPRCGCWTRRGGTCWPPTRATSTRASRWTQPSCPPTPTSSAPQRTVSAWRVWLHGSLLSWALDHVLSAVGRASNASRAEVVVCASCEHLHIGLAPLCLCSAWFPCYAYAACVSWTRMHALQSYCACEVLMGA
jgi:hypothetical protein